jgi:hypothetical protein
MRTALLSRVRRLEEVRAVEDSNHTLRFEFAYLKLLPRDYRGPRHIVTVGRRLDGGEQCEERPGEPPSPHLERQDPNVMKIYFVSAGHNESQ